jgi:hypothetical protein
VSVQKALPTATARLPIYCNTLDHVIDVAICWMADGQQGHVSVRRSQLSLKSRQKIQDLLVEFILIPIAVWPLTRMSEHVWHAGIVVVRADCVTIDEFIGTMLSIDGGRNPIGIHCCREAGRSTNA